MIHTISQYLVYKNPFYEVTPKKTKHKKSKTSSTVSKISKLKSPEKMQSSAHKRFLRKIGGNSQKALKKKFARVLFAFVWREKVRLPQKHSPATQLEKNLIEGSLEV